MALVFINDSMLYPAKFTEDDGGYVVTFRDIPEAITQGDTFDEALEMAADALQTALEFYFEDNRQVPLPSALQAGETAVPLPASLWAKVLLLNEMQAQQVTASELARRMNSSPQSINRIVNLKHASKIDTLEAALAALGRRLVLFNEPINNPPAFV